MVKEGLAQQTINGRIRRIKQVFDWGVSEELVSVNVTQALKTVHGLRVGKTAARAPEPKGPVCETAVDAIKPFVTKPVWGMIQFMLFTGCRPSECCRMKWSENDTSKPVWMYCPKHHKTAHKGKKRIIVIGPHAQRALGHSSKQTTERHYAHVDLSRAEANALLFG